MIHEYRKGVKVQLLKSFTSLEFDCHGNDCSITYIDDNLVTLLQRIRDHFDKPLIITSGYRCKAHNAAVKGGTNSYHMRGMAADIVVQGVSTAEVAKYAESIGVKGIGLYSSFVHVDTRTNKFYWETSWQRQVQTFGGHPVQPCFMNPLT